MLLGAVLSDAVDGDRLEPAVPEGWAPARARTPRHVAGRPFEVEVVGTPGTDGEVGVGSGGVAPGEPVGSVAVNGVVGVPVTPVVVPAVLPAVVPDAGVPDRDVDSAARGVVDVGVDWSGADGGAVLDGGGVLDAAGDGVGADPDAVVVSTPAGVLVDALVDALVDVQALVAVQTSVVVVDVDTDVAEAPPVAGPARDGERRVGCTRAPGPPSTRSLDVASAWA